MGFPHDAGEINNSPRISIPMGKYFEARQILGDSAVKNSPAQPAPTPPKHHPLPHTLHVYLSIIVLFLNYFLAQYDKFILSYFHNSVLSTLSLTATQYKLLSGYSAGIVYALLAIPIAFIADYTTSRVWVLSIASIWWSLCVIFQGLTHNFWQIFCARLGMGIGQAAVEALSVSLISDLVEWRNVFLGESVFYVGVYIGEAVSAHIATAFTSTGTSWQAAIRAIGIVGVVVAVVLRLIIREPGRRRSLVCWEEGAAEGEVVENPMSSRHAPHIKEKSIKKVKADIATSLDYIIRMRSFWLLVLSAATRQLAGNVFGYYMPGYLSTLYPSRTNILSRYGIIVGAVGTVSVLGGGVLTSVLWNRTKLTPVYLTAIGGMVSSLFVLLMIFSKDIADGNEDRGIKILYGAIACAYITAEAWLGALFALIALLLPPAYKTSGLAVWSSVRVLIYSSGPEIIGLALRKESPASAKYRKVTQTALVIIVPVGYWACGVGLLCAIPLLKKDMRQEFIQGPLSVGRRMGLWVFGVIIFALVISLFTVSLVYES